MSAARFRSVLVVRAAAGLVALSVLMVSGPAPAGEVPIFLGMIGVGKAKPEVAGELHSLLRAELSSAAFSRVRTKDHYVLTATLVSLDSIQSSESARATCVVSVAILRNDATLYALIHGRASAEDAQVPAARSDALRAAVHSAMVRVPKALR